MEQGRKNCMTCENFIPMCRMRGEIKDFSEMSGCNGCDAIDRMRYPTVGEVLDVYYPKYAERNFLRTSINGRIGKPRMNTRKVNLCYARKSMKILGIKPEEPIYHVTKKRLMGILDWYVQQKEAAKKEPNMTVYHEATVLKMLECWKSLTSRWMREFAEDDGMVIPAISVPQFAIEQKEWKKPTKQQELNYRKWISDLSEERSMEWAMVIFQRATGCRNGDVNTAKWENFKVRNGKCYYIYTDSKTQKERDQIVPIELLDNLLRWRRFFYSKDGPNKAYRKERHDDPYVFGGRRVVKDDGTVVYFPTTHRLSWDRINRGIKKTGICDFRTDKKGAYQNRALRGNEIREMYGEEAMNHVLHNSKRVSSYYSSYNTDCMSAVALIA